MAFANTINFNVDPYYDDFDEDKNFHRILFKPGRAVQARELTQQQTILQDQINRFGYNVFKEGAEISGSGQFLDNTIVARLQSSYAGTDIDPTVFEGQYARGRTSENLYYIKKSVAATGGENDILHLQFLRYANTVGLRYTGAESNTSVFPTAGEVFDFSPSANLVNNIFAVANSGAAALITGSTASANGLLFHVDEGIYYTNGHFVKNSKQTVAISTDLESTISTIGFNVENSIVTSVDDSTLLDPADGSYNYTAPGADRYKINLTLTSSTIDDISTPNLTSSSYIELARVENGVLSRKNTSSDYNLLGDELARRTFDESGHYSVRGLDIRLSNFSSNSDFLTVEVSPGKAYVKGYEVNQESINIIPLKRARETESVTEQNMTAFYGNYVFANTLSTALFDLVGDRVDLHANTTPTPGDKIGEAYIKNIEYFSGTGDQRVYKIHLFDVRVTDPTLTFATTKCITSGSDASALIHSTGRNTISKFGSVTSGANTVVLNNTTGVTKGQLVENVTHFPDRTVVTDITFDTVTLSKNALLSNTNAELTFSATVLKDREFNRSIFPLPNKYVTNVTNVDYKFKRKFADVTFTSGSATIQTNGGTERFSSGTGSLVNENYFVIIKTGATGALANGENVDMTTGSRTVTTPTPTPGSPASAVINLDEAGFNGTADIITAIDVTGDSRRVKTFANNQTKTFDPVVAGTKYSLGYPDVIRINAIYEGNVDIVTSDDTDVTSNFIFDNGQRDNFYDHATIQLKPGLANTTGQILVDYDRYDHGGGLGYFVADSYPNYDTIPEYFNQLGEEIYLRDTIDFRPVRSSNTSSNTYSSSGKLFENHQIVDSQTFEVELDYDYYLPRVDKLTLDSEGNFNLIEGTSRLKRPPEPGDNPNQMTLARFKINPYTYTKRDVETKIYNNARYTMKDIGNLERRIERVEYYTSLNLLEQKINNKAYTDADGNSLFKNGFVVDPFTGHNIGNVTNPDYRVSIDRKAQVMYPRVSYDAVDLIYSSGSSTLTKDGSYLTVPYSEVAFLNQNTASGFINVNPFDVATFIGTLKLTPSSDIWIDTTSRPDIIVDNNFRLEHLDELSADEALSNPTLNTDPLSYERGVENRAGVSSDFTGENSTSVIDNGDGSISTVTVNYELISETTNIIDSQYIPFMRSRKIQFTLNGMRPNTLLHLYFNGIPINNYVGPNTLNANTVNDMLAINLGNKEIITDEYGSANGFFFIPNGNSETFPTPNNEVQTAVAANLSSTWTEISTLRSNSTGINIPSGTVPVMFVDTNLDTLRASTYAITSFTSEGRADLIQTTKFMERTTTSVVTAKTVARRPSKPSSRGNNNSGKPSSGTSANKTNTDTTFFNDTDTPRLAADSKIWQSNIALAGDPGIGGINLDAAGYTNATDYIVQEYEEKVGRPPNEGEYSFWADVALRNGDDLTEAKAAFDNAIKNEACAANGGKDPLAQTFFINGDFYNKGITLSSVDLFFRTKDDNLPVSVELRPTVNGFPSAEAGIPLTQVTKKPTDVNVPAPGDLTNLTPTNFKFDTPVHLPPGEYALVVLTDSSNYTTFISRVGSQILGSTDFVTGQPTTGSLFKSQNARTWTPAQEEDLCFKMYRADFTTGTNYTATLNANNLSRFAYNATSNTSGQFDIANIKMVENSLDDEYTVQYQLQTKTDGGSLDSFINIIPNQNIIFDSPKVLSAAADLKLKITYKTDNRYVAPYIDVDAVGGVLMKNIINNTTDITTAETSASDGDALAKYVTKKVTLAQGFSATSLKVFLSQNMPQGSTVEVYYKVLSEEDDTPFSERGYVQMSRVQSDTLVNEELNEYREYEYFADGISYTENSSTFNTFNQFAIKVVLYSSSSAKVPTVKNFRAVAFT